MNEASVLLFWVLVPVGLIWPVGAIVLSKKASWRRKLIWSGLWLAALLACLAIQYLHRQYLLASGYPPKLVSRDAFRGIEMALAAGWAIYLLFRYRIGDFPRATSALQRVRSWVVRKPPDEAPN